MAKSISFILWLLVTSLSGQSSTGTGTPTISSVANRACGESLQSDAKSPTKTRLVPFTETSSSWMGPMWFGNYDFWVRPDIQTGERIVQILLPEMPADFAAMGLRRMIPLENLQSQVRLMPGAEGEVGGESAPVYFAVSTLFHNSKHIQIDLYSLDDREAVDQLSQSALSLTWATFRKNQTVPEEQIKTFIEMEASINPYQKMIFVTRDLATGEAIAVLRVVDGSPFPMSAFGDRMFSVPQFKVQKIPIELRYPELRLRTKTDFIFEMGRLAGADQVAGVLEYQFRNFAFYLKTKYGFLGLADQRFVKEGRIYVEVTAEPLRKYMKSFDEKGYGFHLDAITRGKDILHRFNESVNYDQLESFIGHKPDRSDSETKFILSISVIDFINNFH